MDSWASAIARPLIYEHNQPFVAGLFFTSYIFIVGIIMINVIVAILLEKYIEAVSDANAEGQVWEAPASAEDLRHVKAKIKVQCRNLIKMVSPSHKLTCFFLLVKCVCYYSLLRLGGGGRGAGREAGNATCV